MSEAMQKTTTHSKKRNFDTVINEPKKAISFIEKACGLESIEESPASKPRVDVIKEDEPSFYVFEDIDPLTIEQHRPTLPNRPTLPKIPSNSTPEVVVENCSTSPERKSQIESSPEPKKPIRPKRG